MPPRAKKQKVEEEEDEALFDSDASLAEEDVAPKRGRGKKAPAAKGKPKGKKAGAAGGDGAGLEIDEEVQASPRKRAPKVTEEMVDEHGWTLIPPGLMFKDFGTSPNAKIAAFDADKTIITTKSGNEFPKDANDWRFQRPSEVPIVLKELHENGYKIVVFSNQAGIKSAMLGKAGENAKLKFNAVVQTLGIPALVMMATMDDNYRKPSTGMWDLMCSRLNGGVVPDKAQSFYCGDAAGRPTDFIDKSTSAPSTVDKDFAAAIGLPFKVPEEVFGEPPKVNAQVADTLEELSKLMFKIADDKAPFKAIATKKAAAAIRGFEGEVSLDNWKAVCALQGVGKGTQDKIREFLNTGKLQELETLRQQFGSPGGGAAAASPKAKTAPKTAEAQQAMQFM